MGAIDFSVVGPAIGAGLFWGTVAGAIYRWVSRGLPDATAKSLKWASWTALILAIGFFLVHSN